MQTTERNDILFDNQGRLRKIANNQQTKSYIEITYKPSTVHIDTITDGAKRAYKFVYTDDSRTGKLTAIQYLATASFTLDVYGHVTMQMKQASAARMEEYIKTVSVVWKSTI